jgi:hypothetical protein
MARFLFRPAIKDQNTTRGALFHGKAKNKVSTISNSLGLREESIRREHPDRRKIRPDVARGACIGRLSLKRNEAQCIWLFGRMTAGFPDPSFAANARERRYLPSKIAIGVSGREVLSKDKGNEQGTGSKQAVVQGKFRLSFFSSTLSTFEANP